MAGALTAKETLKSIDKMILIPSIEEALRKAVVTEDYIWIAWIKTLIEEMNFTQSDLSDEVTEFLKLADWQRNVVKLEIPGFKVEINEIILEGIIVDHYLNELRSFSQLGKQNVAIIPTEPIFQLEFSFDNRKNINVKGNINYPLGMILKLKQI